MKEVDTYAPPLTAAHQNIFQRNTQGYGLADTGHTLTDSK